MIAADLVPLAFAVDKLRLLPGNPRRGNVDAVKRSLQAFGQRKPIVVRRSDLVVIAGNHTLQAAQALGWDEVAVVWVDDDDTTSKAFALADNRTAELGDYDNEALAELIGEVGSVDPELLAATGWSADAVAELLAVLEPDVLPLVGDPDEVPEQVVGKSVPGDVWLLGSHRVMCGDSTSPTDVEKLMAGAKADMVFTDPPYGMSYGGGRAKRTKKNGTKEKIHQMILNDDLSGSDLIALVQDALRLGNAQTKPNAALYVCFTWRTYIQFEEAILSLDREINNCIVWDKGSIGLGMSHYRPQHEFIFYSTGEWFGDKSQSDVWQSARGNTSQYVHPTQKPTDLIAIALNNSSKPKGLVLDLFGGSGSTLIAAHQTNRVAYLMELDPKYVDVICARFQQVTGIKAVSEATGQEHDFLDG
jgi:DNA modification methylase